ncbi:MAG: PspA/IM30 family protein [Spirochaetales bacterium]|nr:PspA/IM30 family protein [Spirochaetales bacterium]
MGNVKRFKDIVNSNFNAILDKAEDPEKMVKLMIQEMDDSLIDLKKSCSDRVAEKVMLTREIELLTEKINQWQERAVLAASKGKDDLAKEAIQARQSCESDKSYRERDIQNLDQILEETKGQIGAVEAKLNEVQQKYRLLIQRGIHASEKKRVGQVIKKASGASVLTRFDQLENRIERMEAEAELSGQVKAGSFDKDFVDLEREAKVEAELAALKKKLKNQPEKSPESKS